MEPETFLVIQCLLSGCVHTMAYDEQDMHFIDGTCPCKPVVDISAEVNGGDRIYRHNPMGAPQ